MDGPRDDTRRFPAPWLVIPGSVAIVAAFFFGTLFVFNMMDERARDTQRTADVKLLKSALERYHEARGAYPQFPDNFVDDLKTALVDSGYLRGIPHDPLAGGAYRYTTSGASDGQGYGLKVGLERSGDCLTGVRTAGTGWWGGKLPDCPF